MCCLQNHSCKSSPVITSDCFLVCPEFVDGIQLAAKDPDPDKTFVRLAYNQILTRNPTAAELEECRDFLKSQAEVLREPAKLTAITGGPKATVAASTDPAQRARENLTLVLYNHNDFVTIH